MPSDLPATSPTTIPSVIGERERVAEAVGVEVDAGVGEREQRHDHVARPRVDSAWRRSFGDTAPRAPSIAAAAELGRRRLAEGARERAARSTSRRSRRVHGDSRPSATPAIVGMDARHEHREPQRQPGDQVRAARARRRRARGRAAIAATHRRPPTASQASSMPSE